MVGDALRRVMVAADGAGDLEGADVLAGAAEHPVCGDQVTVMLRLRAPGVIDELRWQAQGCPACLAVAAAAPAALRGAPASEVAARLRARLAALGDLAAHERHAERLFVSAVSRALAGAGGGGAR